MRIESSIQVPSETKRAETWYARPAEALADELQTGLNVGLNVDEAARRRAQDGPNDLPEAPEPMNRAVESVARGYLEGREITEGLLNHVEVAIRAYDPCLSCATHALGYMPLEVVLCGRRNNVLARKVR